MARDQAPARRPGIAFPTPSSSSLEDVFVALTSEDEDGVGNAMPGLRAGA